MSDLQSWEGLRLDLYRMTRKFIGYQAIRGALDAEDQAYFDMLDEQAEKGELKIKFEYPEVGS